MILSSLMLLNFVIHVHVHVHVPFVTTARAQLVNSCVFYNAAYSYTFVICLQLLVLLIHVHVLDMHVLAVALT